MHLVSNSAAAVFKAGPSRHHADPLYRLPDRIPNADHAFSYMLDVLHLAPLQTETKDLVPDHCFGLAVFTPGLSSWPLLQYLGRALSLSICLSCLPIVPFARFLSG